MKNPYLFLFDLICLPITFLRIIMIYFLGSRYGIDGMEFLDVPLHAENRYFNQQKEVVTVDTTSVCLKKSQEW